MTIRRVRGRRRRRRHRRDGRLRPRRLCAAARTCRQPRSGCPGKPVRACHPVLRRLKRRRWRQRHRRCHSHHHRRSRYRQCDRDWRWPNAIHAALCGPCARIPSRAVPSPRPCRTAHAGAAHVRAVPVLQAASPPHPRLPCCMGARPDRQAALSDACGACRARTQAQSVLLRLPRKCA